MRRFNGLEFHRYRNVALRLELDDVGLSDETWSKPKLLDGRARPPFEFAEKNQEFAEKNRLDPLIAFRHMIMCASRDTCSAVDPDSDVQI